MIKYILPFFLLISGSMQRDISLRRDAQTIPASPTSSRWCFSKQAMNVNVRAQTAFGKRTISTSWLDY